MFALLLLALTSSLPAHATAIYSCGQEMWAVPTVVEDGRFKGTMTSECVVDNAEHNGLSSLDMAILNRVAHSTVVYSGPTPEPFRDLAGVVYDVSNTGSDDDIEITIRSLDHVATDRVTRHVYASFSTEVDGSGDAKYLREVDIEIVTVPTGMPGQFKLQLTTTVHIKKPTLIPSGMFRRKAEEIVQQQYLRKRAQMMPELAGAL